MMAEWKPSAARICMRCRLIWRPPQSYWRNNSGGSVSSRARYVITALGISCFWWGKRPSCWKYLKSTAKPRRVVPDLLASNTSSSGSNVHSSINSSVVHCHFMAHLHADERFSAHPEDAAHGAARVVDTPAYEAHLHVARSSGRATREPPPEAMARHTQLSPFLDCRRLQTVEAARILRPEFAPSR